MPSNCSHFIGIQGFGVSDKCNDFIYYKIQEIVDFAPVLEKLRKTMKIIFVEELHLCARDWSLSYHCGFFSANSEALCSYLCMNSGSAME